MTAEELVKREKRSFLVPPEKKRRVGRVNGYIRRFSHLYIVEGNYFVLARQPGIAGAGGTTKTPDANPASGATVAPSANPNILIVES